jgi:hypothetical protein
MRIGRLGEKSGHGNSWQKQSRGNAGGENGLAMKRDQV